MTPIINLSDPISILVALILFILILILAKETKKSFVIGLLLIAFLGIIIGHAVEFAMVQDATGEVVKTISKCITMDLIFIFLSFISYLWIDDVEAKENNLKSVNNSLDWFWKKV